MRLFTWDTPVVKNSALDETAPWRSKSLQGAGARHRKRWAYTHLPRSTNDDESANRLAVTVGRVLEEHAPGFGAQIVGRVVLRPSELEENEANLSGGLRDGRAEGSTKR